MKTRILMVCLGNICRSPLAEGILKSKLNTAEFHVDSAGTSAIHEGELPDKRSIDVAHVNKIDITDQRSRPFLKSDLEEFDYIYVMDQSNYDNVCQLIEKESHRQKVIMIMDEVYADASADVPDPYYDSINGFKNVYEMLDEACEKIASKLTK
ncbi:MAG: low molecular weight phosphotyrosine protein phosphatase [Psychroflexus sp.]|nr:low molecular weight phosphotyrosine protein phosphatase [Psychroflexus sp.]MDN6310138.1 low molecular weight phosphotyrosine protein phosphatase [Psychroflexus sp.]